MFRIFQHEANNLYPVAETEDILFATMAHAFKYILDNLPHNQVPYFVNNLDEEVVSIVFKGIPYEPFSRWKIVG